MFGSSQSWYEIFAPTNSVVEIFVRGTIMYLVILALLRFVLKRQTGQLSIPDLLLVVLLSDAAQNAMADEYRSVTEGIMLVGTIIFWNFLLDWLAFRFPSVERLVRPAPLTLIKDGKVIRRHMRQERHHGRTDEQVARARDRTPHRGV